MKIISDLERIAELAVNICQMVFVLADHPFVKSLIDIPKLAKEPEGVRIQPFKFIRFNSTKGRISGKMDQKVKK